MKRIRAVVLGAGGRDFHNFNVAFRDDPAYEVVGFTAAQIPNIAGRVYPAELAGRLYPRGIPIYEEDDLPRLIRELGVDEVVFAYSDVSHEHVMHRASIALAEGANFRLLGPHATMLRSARPVISLAAVRTGCGKSPAARFVVGLLREAGLAVAVVRHPMPYGDLARQAVQRFATIDDLEAAGCTIEEREEYEPHLVEGNVVFAGVDYARVLRAAEAEADLIVWDGGNNDLPFFTPDLEIVLADPHRAGDERRFYPGETNLLRAHVLVITKVDTADPQAVRALRQSIAQANPTASVLEAAMPVCIDRPELVQGKRVLVVEDGPTLTHGGMSFGAGVVAARGAGAAALVDPRPFAVGSIARAFAAHPHMGSLLPATGYGSAQIRELEATIRRVPCELVLVATPIDLRRLIEITQPTTRVRYGFEPREPERFAGTLAPAIARARAARGR